MTRPDAADFDRRYPDAIATGAHPIGPGGWDRRDCQPSHWRSGEVLCDVVSLVRGHFVGPKIWMAEAAGRQFPPTPIGSIRHHPLRHRHPIGRSRIVLVLLTKTRTLRLCGLSPSRGPSTFANERLDDRIALLAFNVKDHGALYGRFFYRTARGRHRKCAKAATLKVPTQGEGRFVRCPKLSIAISQRLTQPQQRLHLGSSAAPMPPAASRPEFPALTIFHHCRYFVINGQKTWMTMAHDATYIFMLARNDPNAPVKQQGISFLLATMDQPGIEVRAIKTCPARRSSARYSSTTPHRARQSGGRD